MPLQCLILELDAPEADALSDACFEAGALSVSMDDPLAGTPEEVPLYDEPSWPTGKHAEDLPDMPGVRGEVEWIETMPAFGQDRAAPLIGWLEQRTGHAAGVIPFYTEAELYRAGLGVPTAVCGPGSIDMAHRVDESILFDELEAGCAFYAEAIAAFCG